MGRTVILGGSGMVGTKLGAQLTESGRTVHATWHTNSPPSFQDVVTNSVTWSEFPSSLRGWDSLLSGADTVIHLANKLWNFSMISANPEAARQEETPKNDTILSMALEFGVKKLVWVSSSVGYGTGTDKNEPDFFKGETHEPYRSLIDCIRDYEQKLGSGHPGLDVRIYRPTTIIGPPPKLPSSNSHLFFRIMLDLLSTGTTDILLPDPGRNYIFVSDFAQLLCEEEQLPPEPGVSEAYNVRAHENWTHASIAREAARQLGLPIEVVGMVSTDHRPAVFDLPAEKIRARHNMSSATLENVVSVTLEGLKTLMASRE